ncbi:hypothetical protein [Actinomyces sp.]|uniref:hypothetical protein n=1 Tax=Actinomyces sp. TaxID=29317 RepID=UPI0029083E33|nr:hypothetical protein [Actinomyces sp.]MDU5232143.1 hypothetical protein [Actinomyces sp.]MDU6757587.1 hypothetical protein [Actinomyces sp.]
MSFGLDAVSSADVFTLNLVAIVVLLQSNKKSRHIAMWRDLSGSGGSVWFQDICPLVWRWGVSGHVSAFKMVL